jgi:hypothetical protein
MRILLKRGRLFEERDRTGALKSSLSAKGWRAVLANEDPVGKSILVPDMQTPAMRQIIGVVGDVRHYGLAEEAPIEIYRPFYQARWPFFTLVARASLDSVQLANTFRQAIASVDKDHRFSRSDHGDSSPTRSPCVGRAWYCSRFSPLALLLAGLASSVMSYSRAAHQEIGVRMALGAQQQDVLMLVTREPSGWL